MLVTGIAAIPRKGAATAYEIPVFTGISTLLIAIGSVGFAVVR